MKIVQIFWLGNNPDTSLVVISPLCQIIRIADEVMRGTKNE
jgi:hypothetical protein